MDENYGKLLYEYSDAVSPLDMTKTQRKKRLKSFTAISILISMLLITTWCVWNFVLDLRIYTPSSVVENYVFMFVILFIVILIAALSVFGLWGKFLRLFGIYRPHEIDARERLDEIRSDLDEYDKRKPCENSIRIYENAIVLMIDGEREFIERSTRYSVTMIKSRRTLFLAFDSEYIGSVPFKRLLPATEAYLLKKYLGDKLTEPKMPKSKKRAHNKAEKNKAQPEAKPQKQRRESTGFGADIEKPALIIGIVLIPIGIIVSLIGYFDLMNGMPPSVGGFFILLGAVLICVAFLQYEVVNIFVIKLAVAAMFIYMGVCFLVIIEGGVTHAPVTFGSLLRHPSTYAIACLFFASVGISFIPNAIRSLVDYIRYR